MLHWRGLLPLPKCAGPLHGGGDPVIGALKLRHNKMSAQGICRYPAQIIIIVRYYDWPLFTPSLSSQCSI